MLGGGEKIEHSVEEGRQVVVLSVAEHYTR